MTDPAVRTEHDTRVEELSSALRAVRERLARAADAAGRDVAEIELLPITKFFPATDVAILTGLGCRAFGESRDQEARDKVGAVADLTASEPVSVRWHMVGQIQRNKARSIATWAHAAHSVSSPRAVTALERAVAQAVAEGARVDPLDIYIQISLDGDVSRGGIDVSDPGAIDAICGSVAGAGSLRLVGLMGIPPLGSDPAAAFARLEREHLRVRGNHPEATGLSAGMSGDLESAVKHGSTCVRVGTALMGQRPLTSPAVVTPVTSSSQETQSPQS